MVQKEENEMELVKEFLRIKGYKSTLECLEKEDNYKCLEKKNAKVSFEFIYLFFIIIIIIIRKSPQMTKCLN